MKLVPLAVAVFAFSALIGIGAASAITVEEDAGGNSDGTPNFTDPDQAVENFGTSNDTSGAGSFTIIMPQQDSGQVQFGGSGSPLLPSFPSGGTSQ